MIAWLNPAAFVGLLALAGPVVIHLLRRQRAKRVPFPSLRFVRPSGTAAVRIRLPSDVGLLAVRLSILLLAVTALARPVWVTGSRLNAWNARTARAMVVDTSDSMRRPDGETNAAARAEALVKAQGEDVFSSIRIDAPTLRSGLERAVSRLETSAPAKREIVVFSDFQRGSLSHADLEVVPDNIGVRLVQTGAGVQERRLQGAVLFGPARSSRQTVVLSGETTAVSLSTGPPATDGLRVLAGDRAAVSSLTQTVASAGAPAPAPEQPMLVRFDGAPPVDVQPITVPWMVQTVLRLRTDGELASAAASGAVTTAFSEDQTWSAVVRERQGRPVVRAAAAGAELVLDVADSPSSFIAAAAVRGVLVARRGPLAQPEQEVLRLAAPELAKWQRPAAPVDRDAWRGSDLSDGRWCWGMVLILLALEARLRRTPEAAPESVGDDAGLSRGGSSVNAA